MDVPAGWYPDPAAPGTSARWWDGTSWTEHATPLTALVAPEAPAYAAPAAETLVLPVSAPSPDFVAPFASPASEATTDTAVLPLGTAYGEPTFPPAPDPAPRRSGPGWGVIALIGALVVVLAVAAVLLVRSVGSGSGGRAAASASPTASTPGTPAPSSSATGSGGSSGSGAAVSAAAAAKVLETFKPSTVGLPAGVAATLIPQGDVAQGEKTLDGWCSSSYATEKDRIARRQWALTQNGTSIGLSVEAVAYATPEQAAAALAEFTAKTRACTDVTLDEDGTSVTQNVTASEAMAGLPDGISGYRGVSTVTGQGTDGTPFSGTSTSTVQQKGQYLTIVWTNQSTQITSGDQHAIDEFVAQQTRALAATD